MMKLLIEEYPSKVTDVEYVLSGLFNLQDVEQKVSVNYVGYYYNPHEKVRDVVFILPKVLIDEKGNSIDNPEIRLKLNLGEYKSLGEEVVSIPKFRNWNGQIHSYPEVEKLYYN